MPQKVASSVVSVDKAFGGYCKYQTKVLSEDRLWLKYAETRTLLDHLPNTRRMSVQLSPRCREKIPNFLLEEERVTVQDRATIWEITQVMRMMQSACEFFHWGLAQLLVVQKVLKTTIKKDFKAARASNWVYQRIIDITRALSKKSAILSSLFTQAAICTLPLVVKSPNYFHWSSTKRPTSNLPIFTEWKTMGNTHQPYCW